MKNSRVLGLMALALMLVAPPLKAMDFKWSGTYRIEGYQFFNPELDKGVNKTYGLHHLTLRPQIVAGDGLLIQARFDLLNSDNYPNSQLGQFFGSGPGVVANATHSHDSNALTQVQSSESLEVTHLYLTYIQEHGALIVGRAPLHFGLGMTYHAGEGPFDHWLTTRDLLGYRVVMGNFYLLPMIAKINEGDITQGDDVNEIMFHAQYEDVEAEMELGFFFQRRRGSPLASDAPAGFGASAILGGSGAQASDSFEVERFNFYAQRRFDVHNLAVEIGMEKGRSGVRTGLGQAVEFTGFGLAAEYEFKPQGSAWAWGLKAGMASGDNPTTDEKFEGYLFHRNYNVAMMLFNHPLGHTDILRTDLQAPGATGAKPRGSSVDTETISNVAYLAPQVSYAWRENWSIDGAAVFGWLSTIPVEAVADMGRNLGMEIDLGLNFSPRPGVQWVNQVGLLFPGAAFEVGGTQSAHFAWGLASKASISF